jgi:hypothetical protein
VSVPPNRLWIDSVLAGNSNSSPVTTLACLGSGSCVVSSLPVSQTQFFYWYIVGGCIAALVVACIITISLCCCRKRKTELPPAAPEAHYPSSSSLVIDVADISDPIPPSKETGVPIYNDSLYSQSNMYYNSSSPIVHLSTPSEHMQ